MKSDNNKGEFDFMPSQGLPVVEMRYFEVQIVPFNAPAAALRRTTCNVFIIKLAL